MLVLLQDWTLWEQSGIFALILLILLQSTNSKREKVWFLPPSYMTSEVWNTQGGQEPPFPP